MILHVILSSSPLSLSHSLSLFLYLSLSSFPFMKIGDVHVVYIQLANVTIIKFELDT